MASANMKSIREFPWISIEALFDIKGTGRSAWYVVRPEVKARWPELAQALKTGKGVYLLATLSRTSRVKEIGANDIVYIGEAGGIGPKSNFMDRIGKHFLKANGHHKRVDGPLSISISERWLSYVNAAIDPPVTRGMYVRLLQLSGETEEQRHRIGEFENLLMFYWSSLQSSNEFLRTPCNTTVVSKVSRKSYFLAPIARLDEHAAIEVVKKQIEYEPSEDAELDFDDGFCAVISNLEPELQAMGYRVSHRRDGIKTIHFGGQGVIIEMTPLIGSQRVKLRKRDLDTQNRSGQAMHPLEVQGIYNFPKLTKTLRSWLLSANAEEQ